MLRFVSGFITGIYVSRHYPKEVAPVQIYLDEVVKEAQTTLETYYKNKEAEKRAQSKF